jgi:peptidoglycan/LPS O-acetylase OafA/YrhL
MHLIQFLFTRPSGLQTQHEFIGRVESVRGIAALTVGIYHSLKVLASNGLEYYTGRALLILFNGNAAIAIFFVLSGFVLGLSLDKARDGFLSNSIKFIIRRIFRIYPAHVVALFLIAIYLIFLHDFSNYQSISSWFNNHYKEPLSIWTVVKNVLFVSASMNPISWTMKVEVLASLLIPVLHFYGRNGKRILDLMMIFVLLVVSWQLQDLLVFKYLFMFYLGLMLPAWGTLIFARLNASTTTASIQLALGLLLLLSARSFVGDPVEAYLEGFGATIVMASILYGPELSIYRILDSSIARFYGKISYSYYLYHFTVLYLIAVTLCKIIPSQIIQTHAVLFTVSLVLLSVSVTTPIAYCSYLWCERRFIGFAKRLTESRFVPNSRGGSLATEKTGC